MSRGTFQTIGDAAKELDHYFGLSRGPHVVSSPGDFSFMFRIYFQ